MGWQILSPHCSLLQRCKSYCAASAGDGASSKREAVIDAIWGTPPLCVLVCEPGLAATCCVASKLLRGGELLRVDYRREINLSRCQRQGNATRCARFHSHCSSSVGLLVEAAHVVSARLSKQATSQTACLTLPLPPPPSRQSTGLSTASLLAQVRFPSPQTPCAVLHWLWCYSVALPGRSNLL